MQNKMIPNPFNKKKPAPVNVESEPIHTHQWELAAKTYAPPVKKTVNAYANTATEAQLSERMQFGVTVLLFQCTLCKNFVKEEMLGTDIDVLEDLIEKVESFGPQLVQHGNEAYVISKYQPSPPPTGTIPVR